MEDPGPPGPEHRFFVGNRKTTPPNRNRTPSVTSLDDPLLGKETQLRNAALRVELMDALNNAMETYKEVQEELQLHMKNEEEAIKSNQLYKKMVEGLLADVNTNEQKKAQLIDHMKKREEAAQRMYDGITSQQQAEITELEAIVQSKETDHANLLSKLQNAENKYRELVLSGADPSTVIKETTQSKPKSTKARSLPPHATPTMSNLVPAADVHPEPLRDPKDLKAELDEMKRLKEAIKAEDARVHAKEERRRTGRSKLSVMDELRGYLDNLDVEASAKAADDITAAMADNPAAAKYYAMLKAGTLPKKKVKKKKRPEGEEDVEEAQAEDGVELK
eukprot:TRINITY_DN26890_c0_g1_i1.p2 TRINITY_DN26890_c0_g1~~TRINITY_DN26890_c0_g1_i1.p2  ORF type:complete len:334 (-),score=62.56 TRINITY_DN26890_c0_g1_i1:2691-3692(-)